MTITTFEEHEEAAAAVAVKTESKPSSPTLGMNSGVVNFHEMDPTKGTRPTPTTTSSVHDRLKNRITSNGIQDTQPQSQSQPQSLSQSRPQLQPHSHANQASKKYSILSNHHLPNPSPTDKDTSKIYRSPLGVTSPLSISTDTLDAAATRTRLRRQRRMLSQNSKDQPEDPIERLNRLRARISGALSEVKGVLNKYSTESVEPNDDDKFKTDTLREVKGAINKSIIELVEPKNDNDKVTTLKEPRSLSPTTNDKQTKQDNAGPIQFRFVKKIRRRSVFNDDDDDNDTNNSSCTNDGTDKKSIKNQDLVILEASLKGNAPAVKPEPFVEIASDEGKEYSNPSSNNKNSLSIQSSCKAEKRRVSIGTVQDIEAKTFPDKRNQRRPSESAAILNIKSGQDFGNLKNEISELKKRKTKVKSKSKEEDGDKIIVKNPTNELKIEKNNLNVEKTDSLRRSSIAAVELSKLESPIKKQRRPSDSEAILKKPIVNTLAQNQKTKIKQSSRANNDVEKKIIIQSPTTKCYNENSCEDGTEKKIHKHSAEMPSMPSMQSINLIDNGTSISSLMLSPSPSQSLSPLQSQSQSQLSPSSLAIIIVGKENTDTATTTPSVKQQIEIPDKQLKKDLQSQLVSENQELSKFSVPSNRLLEKQINEANNSQQYKELAQLNKIPSYTDHFIPPTTAESALTLNKHAEPQKKVSQAIGTINLNSDNKKSIYQKEIIPVTTSPFSFSSPSVSVSSLSTLQQPSVQQVASNVELAVIVAAPDDDNCESEIIKAAKNLLNRDNVTAEAESEATVATTSADRSKDSITTEDSPVVNTKATVSQSEKIREKIMPELQMHPAPVRPVNFHTNVETSEASLATFDDSSKEVCPKKKILVKKIIKKNVCERSPQQQTTIINDKDEIQLLLADIPTVIGIQSEIETENTNETSEISERLQHNEDKDADADADADEDIPSAILPIRERKVKKKVIIKRLQRRLSGNDQTFFIGTNDEANSINGVETLEKPIAYVTDDDDDDDDNKSINQSEIPLKSCIHLREYQVGDVVMYAERYKKTQIRWKKGIVIERITSISYKIDIGDKQVSAHIKDLKKFTGRKVRFGDKEYLEIDYEQTPEIEDKPRTYSIWNMV